MLVDPVVVNFLEMHLIQHLYFFQKNVKNITSVGSSAFQKILQVLDQATLVNFFGNEKILISKKITTMGSKHHLNPIVVFFFEIKFFPFSKKFASVG